MGFSVTRTYSELIQLETFDDRLDYLKLSGGVGRATFGFDRHFNQTFYHSREWQRARDHVIIRDEGCDLGVVGYHIHHGLHVHHMNPINLDDIIHNLDWVLNPDFLITTTQRTHNAIHYGSTARLYPKVVTERTPRDTKLW